MPECPECERRFKGATCPICGWGATRPKTSTSSCLCGSTLAGALCEESELYPVVTIARVWDKESESMRTVDVPTPCPFACPICGASLRWDGGCDKCRGTTTWHDLNTWTFPGERYARVAASRGDRAGLYCHWQRIDGPRRACTQAETREAMRIIENLRDRTVRREEALRELAVVMARHGGIPWDFKRDVEELGSDHRRIS